MRHFGRRLRRLFFARCIGASANPACRPVLGYLAEPVPRDRAVDLLLVLASTRT
jgi:hypothetical protein